MSQHIPRHRDAFALGGWLFAHAGWHSIFWLLVVLGALLWTGCWRLLPESQERRPQRLRYGDAVAIELIDAAPLEPLLIDLHSGDTLSGGDGDDALYGTEGTDTLDGEGGSDTINGTPEP